MSLKNALLLAFFGLLIGFSSCKKDEFITDGDAKLEFSTDTVIFDTVFTTVGSSTEVFVVYNRNDQPVKVSSIRLATGDQSMFRLNVDGLPGRSFSDVEIGADDSIFIFVEVTVDPNNQNTPLVVTDSILFETNGNLQDIDLVAWGQDAYFHKPPAGSPPLFFLDCNDTWNNDKPHVIYGYALVDSACTLTINAGTNVHLHPGSGIIVLSSGTLKVEGTTGSPVTIQGDRLGFDYQEIAGQWDRIWLSNITRSNLINGTNEIGPGSRNSVIRNCVIKNGNIGLHVDTVFGAGETTLRLENTFVRNMSGNALLLRGAVIDAYNCAFANCGLQVANLLYGGTYRWYHCTFANFWSEESRQDPVVLMNNYFGTNVRRIDANFYNCIVYGNNDQELGIDSFPNAAPGLFNYKFDHALLKIEGTFPTSNPLFYNAIIRATGSSNSPRFQDVDNNIYKLDSTSIAIDAGDAAFLSIDPILNTDLEGLVRPQGLGPDLGAYERR